ncbi:MAG TPA: hypothetical protein VMU67_00700 [Steroidobacteraceae bacterium]|nr:hypothetical protein [Steroidobacteraceae bacterium]
MRLIDYAVGSALAAAAVGVAHAQVANPWDITHYNASTYTNTYISGSTAVDNSITNTMAGVTDGICATTVSGGVTISTLSVYYVHGNAGASDNTSSPSNFTNRVLTCLANGKGGLASGTPIAVFKESVVGSANGVEPLEAVAEGSASKLNFINAAKMDSDTAGGLEGDCASGDLHASSSLPAADGGTLEVYEYSEYYGCPSDSVPTTGVAIPTGGVADVEATLLNDPSTNSPIPTSGLAYLTAKAGYDTIWGVPISKAAYYALQTAEGLTSKCPTVNGNQNLDSPTCAPSLTKAQVAGLYTGSLNTWNLIGGLSNPSGDNNVYLCRRDYGSGTEGSFEAYFLGARCGKTPGGSSLSMQVENGTTVWANPSTGTILNCMETMQQGGTLTAYYSNTTEAVSAGKWAIGISSTELKESQLTGADDSIRFVAVDGVLPSLANTINGYWPYFSTDGIYHITSVAAGVSSSVIPSGGPLEVFTYLTGLFGATEFMELNDTAYGIETFPYPSGTANLNGGDATPASKNAGGASPLPVTTAVALTNPSNVWDKASSGTVDNCDTPAYSVNAPGNAPAESTLLGGGSINQ